MLATLPPTRARYALTKPLSEGDHEKKPPGWKPTFVAAEVVPNIRRSKYHRKISLLRIGWQFNFGIPFLLSIEQ